jgi:hypothetical protein
MSTAPRRRGEESFVTRNLWSHFLNCHTSHVTEKSEAIAHCMCKELPVIPVNKVVDQKE